MMEYWTGGVAIWGLCGFLAYGLTLAYFQREFPLIASDYRRSDVRFASVMAVAGPLGLAAATICVLITSHHGFMWRLPPRGS